MKGKLLIIFSIIFIIAGAGLGTYGMYKLDWDFKALDTRVFEEKVYELEQGQPAPTKVVIDARSPVKVVKGDVLKLTYYDEKTHPTTISMGEDGVLTVKNADKFKWDWNMFKFKESKLPYQLTLPSGIDLDIDATLADINLSGLSCASVNIDVTNLDLTVEDSIISKMSLESVNATVKINNSEIKSFESDCTNLTMLDSSFATNKIKLDGVNITLKLTVDGAATEYNVIVDSVGGDNDITPRQGSDPNKVIEIESVNVSGYLKFIR